jgi:hypothetical protein
MDPENTELPSERPPSKWAEPEPRASNEPAAAEESRLDPAVLVEQMVAAGVWPEPELLEQIVEQGDVAVEPLVALLRTDPQGWPADAPVSHAIGLLSMLRPSAAIPELVDVIRRYDDETVADATEALERFGPPGFEALLALCRDRSITGSRRSAVNQSAMAAASGDPALRSQLAEVLRSRLGELMDRARDELKHQKEGEAVGDGPRARGFAVRDEDEASESKEDVDSSGGKPAAARDEDLVDQDEDEYEPEDARIDGDHGREFEDEEEVATDTFDEIGYLIEDLADLADPLARDLIQRAFEEGLVDRSFIDEESVDELYEHMDDQAPEDRDWLTSYREDYKKHLAEESTSSSLIDVLPEPRAPQPVRAHRPEYADAAPDEPPLLPVTTPIRNIVPKLGRNDPCWCGSGKKYKKCHLGKDTLA